MSAEHVIANTLRLAQADLDAAKLLHAGKNRYAVYHCEQAAEKIIKALYKPETIQRFQGRLREAFLGGDRATARVYLQNLVAFEDPALLGGLLVVPHFDGALLPRVTNCTFE
jgi:hypothetical protein